MPGAARKRIDYDLLIVGGGIAGASLGAETAGNARCLLIDGEPHCGMHATGRSAAFWLESYGGPVVAPLSAASRSFLSDPSLGFSDRGFLSPRGAIHVSVTDWPHLSEGVESRRVGRAELERLIPGIREPWRFALLEPGCADIDVAALHDAYLRQFRRRGGSIATNARLMSAKRLPGSWVIELAGGETLTAAAIANAAGAWADAVAEACSVAPFGIVPKRRTMVQLRVGRAGVKSLPLVSDSAGTFYFKGESDRSLWLSPHDEIDSGPCDAAPEEIDIATAIDRFEQVVDWPVEAIERSWAGLRSFAPDRLPVYGFDPAHPGFFWCVGQGGFGIQTAPAAAKMAASLLLGEAPDSMVADIDPSPFAPGRFR